MADTTATAWPSWPPSAATGRPACRSTHQSHPAYISGQRRATQRCGWRCSHPGGCPCLWQAPWTRCLWLWAAWRQTPPPQVKHEHGLLVVNIVTLPPHIPIPSSPVAPSVALQFLNANPVRDCRRGGLVDNPLKAQPCNDPYIPCRMALGIIEIGWHPDCCSNITGRLSSVDGLVLKIQLVIKD
jgi:hypothetical protein